VNRAFRLLAAAAGAGIALIVLAAASRPALLGQTHAGLWEVSRVPARGGAQRICLSDPALLARFEHRNGSCTQTVIRDQAAEAEVRYSCAGRAFGQTSLSLITPRSLRIETQGISGDLPFHYVLHARRIGEC
jgi:hypothetical protein